MNSEPLEQKPSATTQLQLNMDGLKARTYMSFGSDSSELVLNFDSFQPFTGRLTVPMDLSAMEKLHKELARHIDAAKVVG